MLCAAIPYRTTAAGGIEVLLVTSRGKGRWILPKGKVEPGMTASQSAEQEVYEEAGATGVVDQISLASFDIVASANARDRLQIFALEVSTLALIWPEMFQRQRRWASLEDAANLVKGGHFRKALRVFALDRAPFA